MSNHVLCRLFSGMSLLFLISSGHIFLIHQGIVMFHFSTIKFWRGCLSRQLWYSSCQPYINILLFVLIRICFITLCVFFISLSRGSKPNSIYWLKCQSIYRLVHFRLLFVSNKVIAYYLLYYKPYLILFFLRVTEVFPFLANVVISAVSKKNFAKISFPRNTMNVDQPFYLSTYKHNEAVFPWRNL